MKNIKSKINKIIKNKYFYYLLSFFLPILILLIIFFIKGIFFDGERLSFGDMQAQYMDMLIYFKNILKGKESIFYSITKGLGGDMFSTVTYYMISPINLIVMFFKDANIMQAIYLIILIKFGLTSLSMFTYLNYKDPKKKKFAILFSLAYALMAYSINNYFCIMWFDAIYMVPLVLLGIDKLINSNNSKIYIFTLFYTIFTNYYMGYMVCIFSVIYFIYSLLMKYTLKDKKVLFDVIIKFITCSLLAGLMACVIYLPSIVDVMKANRSDITDNATSIQSLLTRLFIGSYNYDNLLSYYEPNLYCGFITLILVILYFFNDKHTDKEKYILGTMVLTFILSIFVPKLDLIWHGFSYPIGYNYRFTFIFTAFFISIAYQEFSSKSIPRNQKNAILGLALLLGMYSFSYNDNIYSWLSVFLVILYSIILFSKSKFRNIILSVLVIFELSFNAYISFFEAKNKTNFDNFVNEIVPNFGDSNTYRVAGDIYYGTNELTASLKSTTKGFYSTMNNNISDFYNLVGMSGGPNYYEGNIQSPPILSSLFGVKYIYSDSPLLNYEKVNEVTTTKLIDDNYVDDTDYIYINNNALNFGYIIRSNKNVSENVNPFMYQNLLIKNYSGLEKDILLPLENGYNENLIDSKYIYMILFEDVKYFTINGMTYNDYPTGTIIAIENNFNTNDIEFKMYNEYDEETNNYICYYLDLGNFNSAINNLRLNQLENIKINKNKITGKISVGYDATMVLSIPYEKGWTVYVDGVKTSYYQLNKVFMAIDLKSGNHNIKLVYKSPTIYVGLFISLMSCIMAYIYLKPNNKNK